MEMQHLSGVEKTVRITEKYKLVSREFKKNNTIVNVDGVEIGGSKPVVMAGPCAVESMEQLMESAEAVASAGAQFLRGKEEFTSLPLRHGIWRHSEFHRQVGFQIAGVKVLHCRDIQSGVSHVQGFLQFK